MIGLALFLTLFVMGLVMTEVNGTAIQPLIALKTIVKSRGIGRNPLLASKTIVKNNGFFSMVVNHEN